MEYREVASKILAAVGGSDNVTSVMTCLTRLRLTLTSPDAVKSDELKEIKGVLGTVRRGRDGIEVVLGPASIEGVSREFSLQSGVGVSGPSMAPKSPMGALANAPEKNEAEDRQPGPKKQDHIVITPGRRSSYRAQQRAAINDERLGKEDMDALRAFLDEGTKAAASAKPEKGGKSRPCHQRTEHKHARHPRAEHLWQGRLRGARPHVQGCRGRGWVLGHSLLPEQPRGSHRRRDPVGTWNL